MSFHRDATSAQRCRCLHSTTCIELRCLSSQSYRTTSLLGCQMSGVWSSGMDLSPTSHWWPHSSSITLWQSVRLCSRNECWCSSPGRWHRKCSNFHVVCEKSNKSKCRYIWYKTISTWHLKRQVCALLRPIELTLPLRSDVNRAYSNVLFQKYHSLFLEKSSTLRTSYFFSPARKNHFVNNVSFHLEMFVLRFGK